MPRTASEKTRLFARVRPLCGQIEAVERAQGADELLGVIRACLM